MVASTKNIRAGAAPASRKPVMVTSPTASSTATAVVGAPVRLETRLSVAGSTPSRPRANRIRTATSTQPRPAPTALISAATYSAAASPGPT
jgi:hypothetical protein